MIIITITKVHFLLSLLYYHKVMEALFSVKIFDVGFSPNYVTFGGPQSAKKGFLEFGLYVYVCV